MTLIVSIENDEALFEEHEEDGRTSSEPHTKPDSFTLAQLRARVHRKMLRTLSPQDTKKNKEEKQ
jgi:hypothetical protein